MPELATFLMLLRCPCGGQDFNVYRDQRGELHLYCTDCSGEVAVDA